MARSAKQLARRVEDLKDDVRDAAEDTIDNASEEGADTIQSTIEANDSVATGMMRNLVRTELDLVADDRGPNVVAASMAISAARYSAYVEYGTGAFTHTDSPVGFDSPDPYPPPRQIQLWIENKGIVGDYYSAEDRGDGTSDLAWAIADVIGELGNRAHPFMRPAFRTAKPLIVSDAEDRLTRAMSDF